MEVEYQEDLQVDQRVVQTLLSRLLMVFAKVVAAVPAALEHVSLESVSEVALQRLKQEHQLKRLAFMRHTVSVLTIVPTNVQWVEKQVAKIAFWMRVLENVLKHRYLLVSHVYLLLEVLLRIVTMQAHHNKFLSVSKRRSLQIVPLAPAQ
eukprot:GFUD01043661.1.p2 GENE.GFUD01043661.1~~GFUD01043661.1.p2  ORF type:complete len:150 (+),score=16.46 GFUD01043661.1:301-750(+)